MHSNKAGLYSVSIKSEHVFSIIKNKKQADHIYMSVAEYNNLSKDKKKALEFSKSMHADLEKNINSYKEGIEYEFNSFLHVYGHTFKKYYIMDGSVLSKEYYIFFLAGFLDSAKSYSLLVNDYEHFSIKNIKSVLDYLDFVYKEITINDNKYLIVKTENPFCRIAIV